MTIIQDTPLEVAVELAHRAADRSCLPQTVYRSPTSMGWWHTAAVYAGARLPQAEFAVSILPSYYFGYMPAQWPRTVPAEL